MRAMVAREVDGVEVAVVEVLAVAADGAMVQQAERPWGPGRLFRDAASKAMRILTTLPGVVAES
jgi:hypothetical protein